MAEYETDIGAFKALFRRQELGRSHAVRDALREAALLGAEVVARAVPVDVGAAKGSVHAVETADGAEILVDAPHAAVLEVGARPHVPPLAPLIDWVRRHAGALGVTRVRIGVARTRRAQRARDRAYAALVSRARAIQAKIAREGSKPHWYMRNSLPKLESILQRAVRRKLAR